MQLKDHERHLTSPSELREEMEEILSLKIIDSFLVCVRPDIDLITGGINNDIVYAQ